MLIVRSQDKEIIMEVSEIRLDTSENSARIYGYGHKWQIIGGYESKERALEVMANIQKRIANIKDAELISNRFEVRYDCKTSEFFIFEMPEK